MVANSELVVSMKFRVTLVAGLLAVSGCTTTGLSDTKVGAAAGAIVGGVTGNQAGSANGKVASTILAAMGNGLIGGSAGAGMDDRDRRSALEAEYKALEYTQSGQPVSWKSERSGFSGQVVAAQPYRVGSQDCRQYTHTVYTSGQTRTARGTACRNTDGSWTPLT
jgi:surface antigen